MCPIIAIIFLFHVNVMLSIPCFIVGAIQTPGPPSSASPPWHLGMRYAQLLFLETDLSLLEPK